MTRPCPTQWSIGYWLAFQELNSSRNWTQGGATEILYLAKLAWLDENLVWDKDDRDDYLFIINQLDIEYLKQFETK